MPEGPGTVLDASAVLALLDREPGWEDVEAALVAGGCVMSAVNAAEVIGKLVQRGLAPEDAEGAFASLGAEVVPFALDDAASVGALGARLHRSGLSLGDRARLALGAARRLPVPTADRQWTAVASALGVALRLIR